MQIEISSVWIILMFYGRKTTLPKAVISHRLLATKLQGSRARVVYWPGVVLECVCLKVKEFKIVSSLVPFVLLVVLTWPMKLCRFVFVFESPVCVELEIRNWLWFLDHVQALVLFPKVASGSYVSRGALICFCYSRLFYQSRISHLIVLSCKQHKVICCSSLKFFVCNSFVMLGVILSSSWIIFTQHNIKRLLHARFESSMRLFGVMNDHCVSTVVSTSTWDLIIGFPESLNFHIKWVTVTALLGTFLGWILSIVLRSWCSKLAFENHSIFSSRCFEGGGAFCSCFGCEFGQKVL